MLYSQSTQQTYPYPRNDGKPIVGLDPDIVELTEIHAIPPEYNPETQSISDSWEVDVDILEYRQVWTVTDLPDPPPPPNYPAFNIYMLTNPDSMAYDIVVNNINPKLLQAIAITYNNIVDRGTADFLQIFPLYCEVAGVTSEHRKQWADKATELNLPNDFIAVIRG